MASLIDTSVWVASVFSHHPAHERAQHELGQATSEKPAYFCRSTQQSFLRLITTPLLLRQYNVEDFTNRAALMTFQLLNERPEVAEIYEPTGTLLLWHKIASLVKAAPKVWMDAYLAAFAISGGLRFVTLDKDFKNFSEHSLELRLLTA